MAFGGTLLGVCLDLIGILFSTSGNLLIRWVANRDEKKSAVNPDYKKPKEYLDPLWYLIVILLFGNGAIDFAAFQFATMTVLAPLASVSIVLNSIVAYFLLGEKFTFLHGVGSLIMICGATLTVITGPPEAEHLVTVYTVWSYFTRDQYLGFVAGKAFLLLCSIAYIKLVPVVELEKHPTLKAKNEKEASADALDNFSNNGDMPIVVPVNNIVTIHEDGDDNNDEDGSDSSNNHELTMRTSHVGDDSVGSSSSSSGGNIFPSLPGSASNARIASHIREDSISGLPPIRNHTRDNSFDPAHNPATPNSDNARSRQNSTHAEDLLVRTKNTQPHSDSSPQPALSGGKELDPSIQRPYWQRFFYTQGHIVVWAFLVSGIGSYTNLFGKIFVKLIAASGEGNMQFTHWGTYLLAVMLVVAAITQLHMMKVCLARFESIVIMPSLNCMYILHLMCEGGMFFNEFGHFTSDLYQGLFALSIIISFIGIAVASSVKEQSLDAKVEKTPLAIELDVLASAPNSSASPMPVH